MRRNVGLWIVQGLVAAVFLLAGGMKLVMPAEALRGPIGIPVEFWRFIGTAEVLGAVGLILPGLLGIRRALTPLAACGLVIIMTGATVISGVWMSIPAAIVPFVVGALCVTVVCGRRDWLRDPSSLIPNRGSLIHAR
jgi:hypothetical protein